MINNLELEQILNKLLNSDKIHDYAPNGLQIEGKSEIKKIVTGVTASQALLDYAVSVNADAIIVHHGYFWKSENPCIRGMKGKRIQTLLTHNINLYAYHLPLDIHPTLGNNAQLAKLLGILELSPLEDTPNSIPMYGFLPHAISGAEFANRINQLLHRPCLHCANDPNQLIHKIGLCTGGGQGYVDLAANKGCDAFISGEISEQTVHSAREQNIQFFAAGHHATERYGIQALSQWLAENYPLSIEFKDIDNPA